jgi:hypothetical protein
LSTPARRTLSIWRFGLAIVPILAGGIGVPIYELVLIERNVNQSAAASATTLTMVNQALKGAHANGDDGLLFLTNNLLQNGAGRHEGQVTRCDIEDASFRSVLELQDPLPACGSFLFSDLRRQLACTSFQCD